MASSLVLAVVKYGLLALLWLFVIAAFRTVRSDLFGSRLERSPASAGGRPTAAPERGRRGTGQSTARRLVVTEGPLAGTTLSLGSSAVTLGRADDSTLVLTDDYASTRHARLVPGPSAWMLEDLGSTNGTYLGEHKVEGSVPVPIGAAVRIGKTVLELRR